MLEDTVNNELSREPFIPLRICVSDGHSYVVRNPNLCVITRGALYIARSDRLHSRLADGCFGRPAYHAGGSRFLKSERVPDFRFEEHW